MSGQKSTILQLLLLVLSLVLFSHSVFAADPLTATPDWMKMAIQLFGGLALFLFGMEQMAGALKSVAGERMKLVLAKLTSNRFMGAITGAFVTAVIQSSSVTTVLVVGFISAGLMSMAQSAGVIMGANIGTTITAQIVAFKVTKYAMLMIAVGFSAWFFSKNEKIKHYGTMLMGLGLIFFGMSIMSDAMAPLRSYQPFLDLMVKMENPFIGILIAALFTALVQSSSATTGIVIVMASQGFITLPAGIALAFGANIGTCVTAMLAAIGKPREAIRAALVHVLFNVAGVLLWLAFIPNLAEFVMLISPVSSDLPASARLAVDTPRQIANAHTIFNLANTLIFIGFIGSFARIVEMLVPDKPLEEAPITKPRYLDEELLETPSLALDMARLEISRAGAQVETMLNEILPAMMESDKPKLSSIREMDEKVDVLHQHIVSYLGRLSRKALSESQSASILRLMSVINDLEYLADLIERDMVGLGYKIIQEQLKVSPETQRMLHHLHTQISQAVALAIRAVKMHDQDLADQVIGMKTTVEQLFDAASSHQASRLVADAPNRLSTYTLEVEIIEKLRRIYHFADRIAQLVEHDTMSIGGMETAAD
ncbi:MAG: Na/Pi cotransporter family protein [Candidatus Thiodiazotropha sp. (ex Gloverina cf. vestifex)]|nr:Na/Pi cotransporter family protein [Candidatus Thiodiazotropha sp. (ex Gloverina cf. vestifex)]